MILVPILRLTTKQKTVYELEKKKKKITCF